MAFPTPEESVLNQCNDLLKLQHQLFQKRQNEQELVASKKYLKIQEELQAEILKHKETLDQLEQVKDSEAVVAAEMSVLKRQLEREKATFDKAFHLLHSKEVPNSIDPDTLMPQIIALQSLCEKKDQELKEKSQIILKLHKNVSSMKEAHKGEVKELKLEIQQLKKSIRKRKP